MLGLFLLDIIRSVVGVECKRKIRPFYRADFGWLLVVV